MLPLFCSFPYKILELSGKFIVDLTQIEMIEQAWDEVGGGKKEEVCKIWMTSGRSYIAYAPLSAVAKKISELIAEAKAGSKRAK